MTNARFQPRAYAVNPKQFGVDPELVWRPTSARASADEQDQRGAAKLQHRLAIDIRKEAARQHESVRAYCEYHGLSYQRMTRMLRGEIVMRLEDAANARRNLGVEFR